MFKKRGFLTSHEATIILSRVQRDRGDAVAEKLTLKGQLVHLRDWKLWEMAVLLLCNVRMPLQVRSESRSDIKHAESSGLFVRLLSPDNPPFRIGVLLGDDVRASVPAVRVRCRCEETSPPSNN